MIGCQKYNADQWTTTEI